MIERDSQFLSFDEDGFDLESHKKTAETRVRKEIRTQRIRRHISIYKVMIMVLAFVVAYCLYHLTNEYIQRYEYKKYHTVDFMND